MTTVRELVAKFGVDFDDKGAKKAETSIDALKGGFRGLLGVIGGAELLRSTWEFIRGQVEMGNSIKVTSERIGVTTDELQKFRFAAAANAISTETADSALQRFSMNMGAAGKGAGPAGKAVHALGIKMKDQHGNLRPVSELLGDVADKMQAAKSPAERLRMAFELFGRGGVQMASVLKDGRKGLQEYGDEAEELGGIMSEDQIETSHKVEVAMHKLGFAYQGVKNEIMKELLPSLKEGLGVMLGWVKDARELTRGTHIFEAAVAALVGTLAVLGWPLIGPLLAAGLAMAAIALAGDEIITTFTGGDSLIRRMVDGLGGMGTTAKGVDALKLAFQGLGAAVHDATTDFEKFVRLANEEGTLFNTIFNLGANAFRGAKKTEGRGIDAPLVRGQAFSGQMAQDAPTGYHDVDGAKPDVVRAGRGMGGALDAQGRVARGIGKGSARGGERKPYDSSALNRYAGVVGPGLTPEETKVKGWRADLEAQRGPGYKPEAAGPAPLVLPLATAPSAPSAAAPVTVNQQLALSVTITDADKRASIKQMEDAARRILQQGNRDAFRIAADHGDKP